MRKLSVLVGALAVMGVCSLASAQNWSDGFESYATGTQLHGVGGWVGWDNVAAAGAPTSDNFAHSGKNSVLITGATDLVHEYTAKGGTWEYSAWQYIPSGSTGTSYFIMLNQYSSGRDWSVQTEYHLDTGAIVPYHTTNSGATIVYDEWVKILVLIDLSANTKQEYYNGVLIGSGPWDDNVHGTIEAVDLYANNASPVYYDDLALIYTQYVARDPNPADGETDIARDAQLSWASPDSTATNDVYFGTSYADVQAATATDPLGVLVSEGQSDMVFAPAELLEYGQTYYWRIDELDGELSGELTTGKIWSFTAETFSSAIAGGDILATASSTFAEGMTPDKTIDGSGLDGDLHGTLSPDMWLSGMTDFAPWIQYEFDKTYKLDKMLVWNSNQPIEPSLGFGVKGVTIEISMDGEAWTALGDFEFAQAPGLDGYAANTTVDFAGAAAKYVKLVITSNWGGLPGPAGLSEVRFYQIPTHARKPSPAVGATGVQPLVDLSWRAGREAVSHQVFVGTDANDLTLAGTVDVPVCQVDLGLNGTYYWKVVEVNEADTPSEWEGDIWSFSTSDFVLVDDFESYGDDMNAGNAIFQTWVDGVDDPTNGGSVVGNTDAPFAERTTVHGGAQSMPFTYNNAATASFSQTVRTFNPAQNWTKYGVKTLSLWFYGSETNFGSGQLYVKVNAAKVSYSGDAANLTTAAWTQWTIDLAATGTDLTKVTTLAIGMDGSGATGKLLIDDIRLYP